MAAEYLSMPCCMTQANAFLYQPGAKGSCAVAWAEDAMQLLQPHVQPASDKGRYVVALLQRCWAMMMDAPVSPMFSSWRRSRETGPFLLLEPPSLFASTSGRALRSAWPLARTVWCRCLYGRLMGPTIRDDEHAAPAR